jgi:hypothetical protein
VATADFTGAPLDQPANSGPTIFTSLQQQLGLSLQPRKNQALCKVVNRASNCPQKTRPPGTQFTVTVKAVVALMAPLEPVTVTV